MAKETKTKVPQNKKHYSAQHMVAAFFKYLLLIISAIAAILSMVVVLFGAFKTTAEFSATTPLTLPKSWLNFENFKTAFVKGNMVTGFLNTVIVVGISVFLTIVFGTMTAYVINRFKFKFSKIVNTAFLVASLIPSITMQMSVFQIISKLGLFNHRAALIILFAGTDIISIYIFVQFLENISVSLDESAIIDGASYFTIYTRILLPLMKPAIVTVLIIKGIGFYNEFYTAFLYNPNPKLAVVSTALFKFKGPFGAQWEIICAGVIITIIPALIIFLLLQKQIYSGLTNGAVKG